MGISQRKPNGFRLPAVLSWKQWILCALLIDLLPAPLFAQDLHYPLQDKTAARLPATPDDRVVVNKRVTQPQTEKTICSLEPFPGLPGTVSIASLQIPSKAQKAYADACVALKDKKLPEAEQHLRRATELYPQYVAGWVMLGQTLETRQQAAEARDACSRAATADPNYLPAYLCLAEIAGRRQEWDEVLNQTRRALELDVVNDAYAYFFSAIAYFNLNQLSEAEASALKAESIDTEHREPVLQLLLAQIYQAKNDSVDAASHLREYQKLAPDAEYSDNLNKDSLEELGPK
jgi:tetratricopeptide (TPR) repeat protein